MASVAAQSKTATALRRDATRLPTLRMRLHVAQRRWRYAALIICAVWSAVAALTLSCLQAAVVLLLPWAAISDELWPRARSIAAIQSAIATFAAAFAISSVVSYLRTPNFQSFARTADRTLALRERLSTALQIDERTPPGAPLDPVRGALLADVERRAPDIDPRTIVSLDVPRVIWLVPALLMIAALLHFVPIDALASRNPVSNARASSTLSKDAVENALANLRRVADLLKEDADQRADPYLRTIAREIERLGTAVEYASLDRRQLASALDRLLAHSRQAYAQNRNGGSGEAHAKAIDLLAAAREDIAGLNPDRLTAPHPQENAGTIAPAAAEGAAPGTTTPASSPSRPQRQARTGAAIARPLPNGTPNQGDAQKDGDDYGDLEADPRTQKERAFAEEQRRIRAAAQAVGAAAAADAGAGEGDRAGNGTRPLGNSDPTRTGLTPGADMRLPDQAGNDGRRIRIELMPQTTLSDVAPPTESGDRHWRHAVEQPVARSVLDASDRKVLGRYFTPPPEGSGR